MFERITGLFLDFEDNGLFWPAVSIFIVLILLVTWFLTRKIRLWYWKVDSQVDALKSIDNKLAAFGEGITVTAPESEEPQTDTPVIEEPQNEEIIKRVYTEEELEMLIKD